MKKRYKLCIIILCFFAYWGISIANASILTLIWGQRFEDYEQVGYSAGSFFDDLRVVSYSPNKAKVYYFADDCGEKVVFKKVNGEWIYTETLGTWSIMGSAENYFLWPYFRNWVP